MTAPRCDHALLAAFDRSLALTLEATAVLLTAMRDSLPATTPPKSLRACLASVRTTGRYAARLAERPRATPDDDPPEAVRADAELRALARALREQAEGLAADLTRLLRTPRARRHRILGSRRAADRMR
jgi:hypothetical protein